MYLAAPLRTEMVNENRKLLPCHLLVVMMEKGLLETVVQLLLRVGKTGAVFHPRRCCVFRGALTVKVCVVLKATWKVGSQVAASFLFHFCLKGFLLYPLLPALGKLSLANNGGVFVSFPLETLL